jgi:predicted RNA-binding protein (virulence factor B family)
VNSSIPITILEARQRKEETNAGVVQDKDTPRRVSSPEGEVEIDPPAYPKHHGSQIRRGQTVHGYLYHDEVREVDRLVKAAGMNPVTKKPYTRLSITTDLIRIGLAVKLGKEQVDIILPPILELLRYELQGFSNRQSSLLAKIYKKTALGELNVEELLRLAFKNDPDEFNRIIEKNRKDAGLSLGDKHKKHHA